MRNGSREEKSIMLDFYKKQISEKLEQIDNVDFLIKIYSILLYAGKKMNDKKERAQV